MTDRRGPEEVAVLPQLDRRQRRSRAALEGALVGLLVEEPYAAITVEEIVRHADVVRATFYAHYADKDALLVAVVDGVFSDLAARLEALALLPTGSYDGRAVLELVLHALEHPALYRAVLSGAGGTEPRRRLAATLESATERTFARTVAQLGGTARVPLAFAARSLVAQMLTLVEDGLEQQLAAQDDPNADARTREHAVEATAILVTLVSRGLLWSLGLDSGELQEARTSLHEYLRSRALSEAGPS